MTPGLRLDQGPPLAVPLLFFLSAPLFLLAAGIYAALAREAWAVSRWAPETLALSHLIGLGFLGLSMLGALSQMAPVAAGAPQVRVVPVGRLSLGLLLPGTPLLAWGLINGGPALLAGATLIALGLLAMTLSGLTGLARAPANPTRQTMRLALVALLGLVCLGLGLSAWLAGLWTPGDPLALVDAHAALGLIGWLGLLVIGAAYQVVPMLQITPSYPVWATRHLARLLAGLLLIWLMLRLADAPELASRLSGLSLAGVLAGFALLTLRLQQGRRRKRVDTTLRYWQLGMASLLAASFLSLLPWLVPAARAESVELLVGMLMLIGFGVSVVNGMLLKIVPFLAWFHLQAQLGMHRTTLSSMHEFFPEGVARRQFGCHLAALAALLISPWWPSLAIAGGLFLALAALLMEIQLLRAWRLFRRQGGLDHGANL